LKDEPTRVIAVTQDDPFFTGRFFATFIPECVRTNVDLAKIVLLPNFDESRAALVRRLLGLYGAIGFVRLMLRYGAALSAQERRGDRGAERRSRAQPADDHSDYLATASSRGVDLRFSHSTTHPPPA
jgi:hypothetical protein